MEYYTNFIDDHSIYNEDCNYCKKYRHELNETYCKNCGELSDEDEGIFCKTCRMPDIYNLCIYCFEDYTIFDVHDICQYYKINIIKIQKWFRHVKRNKVLWKIANYYSKRKYHPKSKFMKSWIENLD